MKETVKDKFNDIWNNHRKFVVITGFFLVAQLAIVYTVWNHPPIWDASVYIGMGKRLFSGGAYGIWEALRPVMLPLLLGGLWKIGVPMIGFPYLLSTLFATAGLAATYFLVKDIIDERIALYTTGIIASTALFITWTHQVLTGIPSSFLVFFAAYSAYKRKNVLGGGLNSLAFLTRFPSAIVGPALAGYVFLRDFRQDLKKAFTNAGLYTLSFFAVATPFFVFNHVKYGDFLRPLTAGASVPTQSNPDTYLFGLFYVVESLKANPVLLLVPVGLYISIRQRENVYASFGSALLALYAFFTVYPHKEARFLLLFLPFMALFAARGLSFVEEQFVSRFSYSSETFARIFLLVVLALMAVNFSVTHTQHQWVDEERVEFMEGLEDLNGERVAGNDPVVNVYADFRYTPLRPENLNQTYPNVKGEVDYYVFNSCAWYCNDAIPQCQQTVDGVIGDIEQDYLKSVEAEGAGCTFTVYEVSE